jgi:hypothetical protein
VLKIPNVFLVIIASRKDDFFKNICDKKQVGFQITQHNKKNDYFAFNTKEA